MDTPPFPQNTTHNRNNNTLIFGGTMKPSTFDLIPLAIAAQRLGVSRTVAYDLVLKHTLDGTLLNGRWYVTNDSLIAEMAARGLDSVKDAVTDHSVPADSCGNRD
jgi:hypothetical protein